MKIIYKKDNILIRESNSKMFLMIDNLTQMVVSKNEEDNKKLTEVQFVDSVKDLLPNSKVLNIGLGAGYTAKRVLDFNIKKLDIVEIYSTVVDSLKYFPTKDILDNDKCNIYVQDGFSYLKEYEDKYDIIIIDVCQPKLEVSKSIFTQEFFQIIKNKLSSNGVCLLWFYNIKNKKYRLYSEEILNYIKIFNKYEFKIINPDSYFIMKN